MIEKNKIAFGDWLNLGKDIPDNVIDACVTDPPWGIRFMGKKWDYLLPSVEIWKEVYRVLKPGGHMLVCCGTRTQHRMVCNIEDSGFEIRDVIAWHYGTGFPKSLDISKAIDKAAGAKREIISEGKPVKRMIPGADQDKTGSWIKDDGRTFTPIDTKPATELAAQWEGWGTALKPATEFWTLVRKPISEKTIAANVLKWGVGALNVDACRIPFQSEKDFQSATFGTGTNIIGGNYAGGNHSLDSDRKNIEADPTGRFPANLILDDFMAEEMDRQSGDLKGGGDITTTRTSKTKGIYGEYAGGQLVTAYGDSGGASRFFYVAKPSPEERGDSTHPTIKPQALIQYLLKLVCPIEPGRLVLEPFAGSGAHCIAARKLGIDFYACEIGEKEHKEASERLIKDLGLFS